MRAALLALLLATAAAPPPDAASPAVPSPIPSPPWVAQVTGRYIGTVRNAGRMECHRTELALQDGRLVGHYWIDDREPFEGTLTEFVADSDTSGRFTWTDRYGSGVELLVFSPDRESFTGAWGSDQADPANPVWATRGTSCQKQLLSQADRG